MYMIITVTFVVSLLAIISLFIVKGVEMHRGQVLFAKRLRMRCDEYIINFEKRCIRLCTVRALFSVIKRSYNMLAHLLARMTASIAKKIEWRARSVAHKSAKAQKQEILLLRENAFLSEVKKHKDALDVQKVAEKVKL